MKPRCMIVCVEYDDILEMTLSRNIKHFSECCIVTSYCDILTHEVASLFSGVKTFKTDAFTRDGAKFNKGLALEEAFDFFGRDGWMLILDADIILPFNLNLPLADYDENRLYGARRRMLYNASEYRDDLNWLKLYCPQETEVAGFFQLFNAAADVLDVRPWYDTSFVHAGGGDSYFQSLWPESMKSHIECDVLHLGQRDVNWFGRVTQRIDETAAAYQSEMTHRRKSMQTLKHAMGWIPGKRHRKKIKDRIKGNPSSYKWFNSEPEEE